MALDFPPNPTNGQIYDNYYWDEPTGVWNSLGNYAIPNILSNGIFTASSGTTVPLTVRGASGQSANLQEWKSQAGSTLASISASGGLSLNTPLSVQNGGTGATSLTLNGYLKGTGTSAVTSQSGIPAGDVNSGTLSEARLPSGTIIQQTYFTYNTYTNGTGTTYVDIHSGTRPSIVAKRSDSHFIILASMNWLQEGSRRQVIRCLRDGVVVSPSDVMIANNVSWTSGNLFYQWKDTSARTAGTTYTFSFQTAVTAGTWYYNYNFGGLTGTSMYSIWEIVA